VRIIPLASSSKGNAYVVEQGDAALLVDCGVGIRRLKAAYDVTRLRGVLITHNHIDHISGLRSVAKAIDAPVFANSMTAESTAAMLELDTIPFACFENGQEFEVGPFSVTPFSIPHDAADPVGYVIRGDETYFHATDVGTPLASIGVHLSEADAATLESNHDPVMLRTSGRPPSLIQRISGPRGHLSNDQACGLVRDFAKPRLKRLWLAHLSQDCNAPHLALNAMKATLAAMNRADVELAVAPSGVDARGR
jgi:phosphoribosyl 1,2-cyclic phosphodiesterase